MSSKLKNIALVLTSGTLAGTDLMYVAAAAGDTDGQVTLTELAAFIAASVVGGGATAELIRDTIGTALTAGALVTVTPNDAGDTITIAIDTTALDERIRDTIGTALAAGTGIALNVNDGGDTITITCSITQYTDEMARDAIGAALAAAAGVSGGIVITVNDGADTITIGLASSAFQALTDAATIAWDMSLGYNAKVTLTASGHTFGTPTNPVEGRTYTLQVIQDGTGSRTVNWPAAISFGAAGAPTLSTGAGKIDLVSLQCMESSGPTFRAVFNKSA